MFSKLSLVRLLTSKTAGVIKSTVSIHRKRLTCIPLLKRLTRLPSFICHFKCHQANSKLLKKKRVNCKIMRPSRPIKKSVIGLKVRSNDCSWVINSRNLPQLIRWRNCSCKDWRTSRRKKTCAFITIYRKTNWCRSMSKIWSPQTCWTKIQIASPRSKAWK